MIVFDEDGVPHYEPPVVGVLAFEVSRGVGKKPFPTSRYVPVDGEKPRLRRYGLTFRVLKTLAGAARGMTSDEVWSHFPDLARVRVSVALSNLVDMHLALQSGDYRSRFSPTEEGRRELAL